MAGISHEAIPPKLDSIEPEAGGLPAGVKVKAADGAERKRRLEDAIKPLAAIADAFDANDLDDEARKYWGRNGEHENTTAHDQIELYQGRGGRRLLTLADCMAARAALSEIEVVPAPVAVPAGYISFQNGPVMAQTSYAQFLSWIADRLEHVHGENPNYDYMHRLRQLAASVVPVDAASPVPSTATQAGAVTEALRECQSALAMMIAPDAIKQTTVISAFAQATAAEAKARTVLSALASSPEPARDRAERRVAELEAAGLHTLGDIERAQSSGERAVKTLPYPPIVISADDNGHEHRVGVHEYRTRERPHGGAITISTYVGDHKWIEALLDPKSAKTLAELILSRPSVAALSRPQAEGWRRQPWMTVSDWSGRRWMTHSEALGTILDAASVTTLSYEEAALIYARARGFIVDDAAMMASPTTDQEGGYLTRPSFPEADGPEALPSAPATGGGE